MTDVPSNPVDEPIESELIQDIEEGVQPEPVFPQMVPALTLDDALADFISRDSHDSTRMTKIQDLLIKSLFDHGLTLGSFAKEQVVPGKHRPKKWDVVYSYRGRIHLAVSCKSIMSNVGGSVPNRIDDAMGECVNVHAYDASIVLGYCFLIENRLALQMNRDARRPWGDLFGRSLASLSGRRSPLDSHELFEAAVLFAVDFSQRPFRVRFDTETLEWDEFCETLLDHVKDRNPTLRNRIETRD